MAPTPEERQYAIDVYTQALVNNGVLDDDATDWATSAVDQAIKEADS